MKFDTMSSEQMMFYLKTMDKTHEKCLQVRNRCVEEIKGMQDRKELLSWEEIASAIAYPKAVPDEERVGGSSPDEFKLLNQAERIRKIYVSQMQELFNEMELAETEIARYKYVNRCIHMLGPGDKEVIERFTRPSLSYEEGMKSFHYGRTHLYKLQKRAWII